MKKIDNYSNFIGGDKFCTDSAATGLLWGLAGTGTLLFGPIGAIGGVVATVAYINLFC